MKLVAGIRLRCTSHDQSTTDLPRNEISAVGPSFDECKAAVEAQVPDGWQITHVRTAHED